jgi:dTDP-4-amino-4,6-dideoxygalactose transaminase
LNNSLINRWAAFIEYPNYQGIKCPNTEYLTRKIVEIPIHQALTTADMRNIVEGINEAIKN